MKYNEAIACGSGITLGQLADAQEEANVRKVPGDKGASLWICQEGNTLAHCDLVHAWLVHGIDIYQEQHAGTHGPC